jgi:hypothetical protein
LSLKTKVDSLLVVWPQNHWDGFLWLDLKTGDDGFLWFGLKTGGSGFLIWASKPTATVWWFEPQNYCDGLLVWASKPCRQWFVGCAIKSMGGCDGVGYTSRSSGLFHMEASWAWASHSGLKTGGGTTAGRARGTIAEVTSSPSWRWTSRCDGLHQILLPQNHRFLYIRP